MAISFQRCSQVCREIIIFVALKLICSWAAMEVTMQSKIRDYLFIAIAFLLGSVNILYNVQFYILWILVTVVFVRMDYAGFVSQVKQNWKYLVLPLVGVAYLAIHYLVSLGVGTNRYAASWNRLEILLLYFFFIPVYVLSAKSFITSSLLKRSLLALCWGTMLFNFAKLFYLTGWTLFTDTGAALEMLYATRFGCHLYFWGGHVYLEPQAIYLSVTAILSFFLVIRFMGHADRKVVVQGVILFILSLWFLSLTVTKGAILAFLGGFLILAFVFFCRMSWKQKLFTSGVVVALILSVWVSIPDTYVQRIKETQNEIENLKKGELVGGSIAPRVALIKESFDRIEQWGICGLGVYKNAAAKEWFGQSHFANISSLGSNVHNCFLEFWMIGGIAGLFFILYYFFVPVVRMIKTKKCSVLVLSVICALFIGCNTSVLISFVDSVPFVIFLLAVSFFYPEQFAELEK